MFLSFMVSVLCFFGMADYNGNTNQWTHKSDGRIIGCAENEDDLLITRCPEINWRIK